MTPHNIVQNLYWRNEFRLFGRYAPVVRLRGQERNVIII